MYGKCSRLQDRSILWPPSVPRVANNNVRVKCVDSSGPCEWQRFEYKIIFHRNTTRAHKSWREWSAVIPRAAVHGIRNVFSRFSSLFMVSPIIIKFKISHLCMMQYCTNSHRMSMQLIWCVILNDVVSPWTFLIEYMIYASFPIDNPPC
jgi:hypothetical protein